MGGVCLRAPVRVQKAPGSIFLGWRPREGGTLARGHTARAGGRAVLGPCVGSVCPSLSGSCPFSESSRAGEGGLQAAGQQSLLLVEGRAFDMRKL